MKAIQISQFSPLHIGLFLIYNMYRYPCYHALRTFGPVAYPTGQWHVHSAFSRRYSPQCLDSYWEANLSIMCLSAVIPSSCCCIKHSVGLVISCIEMPCVRIHWCTFMYDAHVEKKTIHETTNKFRQMGGDYWTKKPNHNAEWSLKKNCNKSVLDLSISLEIP
jgi:hypothetical protein